MTAGHRRLTVALVALTTMLALTSAAHATILLNLYAVHTVVLAHFMIPGDRLTIRKLAGSLIAYSAIALLFAGQVTKGSPTLLGDVIVTISGLLLAERTVYRARPSTAAAVASSAQVFGKASGFSPASAKAFLL